MESRKMGYPEICKVFSKDICNLDDMAYWDMDPD